MMNVLLLLLQEKQVKYSNFVYIYPVYNLLQEHKRKVGMLEEEVGSAKSLYSSALRSLEAISDDIHRQRLERRQQQMLGVRGAGVGAECPFPPPSWEKSHSIEGSDSVHTGSCQILDPLGVIKIPVVVSYQEPGFRRISLTSGNSGTGKDHMSTIEENQLQSPTDSSPQSLGLVGTAVKEQNSPGLSSYPGKDNTLNTETYSEGEFVGGDPLGVLPASYAGRGVILHVTSVPARSTGRQGTNITHPAFSSSSRNSYPTSNVTSVTHPIVSHAVTSGVASQTKPPTVIRSVSVGAPQEFLPPSLIFNNPDKARRQSYRNAVDASQKDAEPQPDEEFLRLPPRHPQPELEGSEEASSFEPVISNTHSSAKLHSSPPHQGTDYGSQLKVPPADWPVSVGVTAPAQEERADGDHHSSTPEKLAVTQPGTNNSCDTSPAGGSPSSTHRSQKLQGLILRIDPAMDPMRFQAAPQKGVSPVSANKVQDKTVKTTDAKQPFSPNSSAGNTPQGVMSPDSFVEYKSTLSKSMIRSASLASAVGSEPSEADLSEIDSVSATQSPTKPPRSRLLNVPASMETVEDSSDTESLASTGPMLDDEQVDFLNKDFSEVLNRDFERGDNVTEVRPFAKRNNWSRMSLPPRLSYLEEYLVRSKALAGDQSYPEHVLVGNETDENGLTMSPTSEKSGLQESSSHVVDGAIEDVEESEENRKDVIDVHL